MHFLLGVEEAIKSLNEYFDYVFAVTNQGGIGLGYMKEKQLNKIHNYMVAELEKKGAIIHEVAYFPTEQQVMLNFQVHDLNEMIQHLEHSFGLKILKGGWSNFGRSKIIIYCAT